MILYYQCIIILLFIAVWCFHEPCIDDSSCLKQGFQCRFHYCLCPVHQFWAGHVKNCLQCPTGWINLFIFCIYYNNTITTGITAERTCIEMKNSVGEKTRLLELIHLNEFYFIQKSIKHILTNEHMNVEVNNSNGILFSSTAFIGSQGGIDSNGKWIYNWQENSNKTYSNSSPMWCREKHWQSIVFPAEPALEQGRSITQTFQALKRWNDSDDACLVSLPINQLKPFLCEIVGESGRFYNESFLSFIFTTVINIIPTTTTTTENIQSINTNSSSLIIIQSLSTSIIIDTTSLNLNLTNDKSKIKQKQFIFIIIGIIGIILIIIGIIIINIQYRKKQLSIDMKSNNKKSLSFSKINKNYTDDIQSNDSYESHITTESIAQKSVKSHQTPTDNQSILKTKSIKAEKLALWDKMESSLFSSSTPY